MKKAQVGEENSNADLEASACDELVTICDRFVFLSGSPGSDYQRYIALSSVVAIHNFLTFCGGDAHGVRYDKPHVRPQWSYG